MLSLSALRHNSSGSELRSLTTFYGVFLDLELVHFSLNSDESFVLDFSNGYLFRRHRPLTVQLDHIAVIIELVLNESPALSSCMSHALAEGLDLLLQVILAHVQRLDKFGLHRLRLVEKLGIVQENDRTRAQLRLENLQVGQRQGDAKLELGHADGGFLFAVEDAVVVTKTQEEAACKRIAIHHA